MEGNGVDCSSFVFRNRFDLFNREAGELVLQIALLHHINETITLEAVVMACLHTTTGPFLTTSSARPVFSD
jgi:hypothetical protein